MKPLLLFLSAFVALLVLALVYVRKRAAPGDDGPWPFHAEPPLTRVELLLYHRLVQALPRHIVLAQVQVSRVLGVDEGFDSREWNNRVNRLSYDFVVCSPRDAAVLAAIELDDSSHEAPERVEADERKDRATAAAGVRMIRWHVKSLPDEAAIRAAFAQR